MKTWIATTNPITETLPPEVAKPVTLRWRSSYSGSVVRAHLESLYNRDAARDAVRCLLESEIERPSP